jgi:hypothetical protein
MPEFYLTQPEVYEGDSLLEATPMLLKGVGLILGISTFIGLTAYYTNPLKVFMCKNIDNLKATSIFSVKV